MKKRTAFCMSLMLAFSIAISPIAQAESKSSGGLTVSSESGTEKVFSSEVSLDPLNLEGRIKVNDLLRYKINDFIDISTKTGVPKGVLDPNASDKASQISGTNWYAAPSLTKILQRIYYYIPASVSPAGDSVDVETTDEPPMLDQATADEVFEDYEDYEDEYTPSTTTASAVPSHSTTNVQVEGVDESDIIKTDGSYIYYMQPKKGIAIFDVRSKTPKQIAMLKPNAKVGQSLPNYSDLYISGNNLVIISTKTDVNIYEGLKGDHINLPASMYERNYNTYTGIDIYDVSKPKNPKLKRQINIQGELGTSRLLNNTVYLTGNMRIYADNESPVLDIMPKYQDSILGEEFYVMSPKDIYLSIYPDMKSISLISFAAVDLGKSDEALKLSAYETSNSTTNIYVSKNALYLTMSKHIRGKNHVSAESGMQDQFLIPKSSEHFGDTVIARFNIKQGELSFASMGRVSGNLKNKYSLDEYNGSLRVLTSRYEKEESKLDLTVLDAKTLESTGKIRAYASGSGLDSVRFRGDTAYISTSGSFEPMLVFDLSKSNNPKKVASLDLKGFTGYLHPFRNKYLIGIGYSVENTYVKDKENKDKHIGYRSSGVEFTMYDISNPHNPKKMNNFVIGGPNTSTVGIYHPKTIMIDSERGTMTMPFYYEDSEIKSGDINPTVTSWKGGLVIEISENGFKEGAHIELDDYYSNSFESRFAYIDNTLYYVTQSYLVALDYNNYKLKTAIKIVY